MTKIYDAVILEFVDATKSVEEISGIKQHPMQYYSMYCDCTNLYDKKFVVQFLFDASSTNYKTVFDSLPKAGEKVRIVENKKLFVFKNYDINLDAVLKKHINFIEVKK